MPTCPGCEQRISYDRLTVHERHCAGLVAVRGDEHRSLEHLEHRLRALEELLVEQLPDPDEWPEHGSLGVEEGETSRRGTQ